MAIYGASFYGTAIYGEAVPTSQKKKMKKVKLELKEKTDDQLVTFTDGHINAMDGNAKFANPDPDAAAFLILRNEFKDALDDAKQKVQDGITATNLKNLKRAALEVGVTKRGNFVESKSETDADVLSSFFQPRSAPTPPGAMPAPQNLIATGGDMAGEVDLQNEPVKGRDTYISQHAPTPEGPWTQFYVGKKSSYTAPGLVSGQNYFFRTAAVGPLGQGPWSDIAEKRAT